MPRFDPNCIDVVDYLECLDVRNIERATEREIRFSCPYPKHLKGDQSPSAYMNLETTKFFCHSCKERGDAVKMASDILGVSPLEAIRMLKQRYSPGGIDPDSRCMVEEIRKIIHKEPELKRENRIYPEEILDRYKVDWPTLFAEWHEGAGREYAEYLLEKRGFEPETLMDWEFGWSERHHRITLPVRDENGNLVGIKARALDDRKPKYLNLRDEENDIQPYLKNEVVFALDRVWKYFSEWRHLGFTKDGGNVYIRPTEHKVIILEGELNAIMMHQCGYQNTVSINGSYFGNRQMQLIKRYADNALLFFDSDVAGYDATHEVAKTLLPFMPVSIVPDHTGDPADMHIYTIRRLISDAQPYRKVMLPRV